MNLCEKYRPREWGKVIGQDRAIAKIRQVMDRPDFNGGAFWLAGGSGIGKTSLAWLIAKSKADDFDVQLLPGIRCGVDKVRDIDTAFSLSTFTGGWKAIIVDEAHGMTVQAVQEWLCLLESLPPKRMVIFTSTEPLAGLFGNFSAPFQRRVKVIELQSSEAHYDQIADYVSTIAKAENLDGRPIGEYRRLVRECSGNIGLALQKVDAGEMLRNQLDPVELAAMNVRELRKLGAQREILTGVIRASATKEILIAELLK